METLQKGEMQMELKIGGLGGRTVERMSVDWHRHYW